MSPAIIATFSNDTAWFHKELVGTNSSITPLGYLKSMDNLVMAQVYIVFFLTQIAKVD